MYLIYMYKPDLALNNQNGWYAIKPKQLQPLIGDMTFFLLTSLVATLKLKIIIIILSWNSQAENMLK